MIFSIFIISCTQKNSISQEIARIQSPDKLVDAVLIRINYHSTVDFVYKVYIVKSNNNIDIEEYELLKANEVSNIQIKWQENKKLIINYTSAKIYCFSNFWQSKEVKNYNYTVKIILNQIT